MDTIGEFRHRLYRLLTSNSPEVRRAPPDFGGVSAFAAVLGGPAIS